MEEKLSSKYAAGFFDGEGSVSIVLQRKTNQVSLRIMIVNIDFGILNSFKSQFGGYLHKRKPRGISVRECFLWTITSDEGLVFLNFIFPHIRIKKPQISLALRFGKFMKIPKRKRCHAIQNPRYIENIGQRRTIFVKKPETIMTGISFKEQMNILNCKRGKNPIFIKENDLQLLS